MNQAAAPGRPELSVVLATDRRATIEATLEQLRVQTAAERIELVLVGPPEEEQALGDESPAGLHSIRIVRHDPRPSLAAARAAGVEAASASLIAFAETHCLPEADWAEALIEAHRGGWAAVGPEMHNANPKRSVSRAQMLIGYGPWHAPATRGPVDHLPGRNSCYKRAALLEYRSELASLLDSESLIHWDMRSRGKRLLLEPSARVRHRNIDTLGAGGPELFLSGRMFASLRSREWPWARRALYAAGTPLVPPLRLARIVERSRRRGHLALVVRTLPALICLLAVSAAGELVGTLFGARDSTRRRLAARELVKS